MTRGEMRWHTVRCRIEKVCIIDLNESNFFDVFWVL